MPSAPKYEIPENVFKDAIRLWWDSKKNNAAGVDTISKNGRRPRRLQGGVRDDNLRGDTMDGFRDEIRKHLIRIGVDEHDIFSGGHFSTHPSILPSFFRASKNWDLIVVKNSRFKHLEPQLFSDNTSKPVLIAAIEFKSQHQSIGNNQNNRIEESIGNAIDFWDSFENRNFAQLLPRPWLGYLFVGRYGNDDVRVPVEIKQPHFLADDIFLATAPNSRNDIKYNGPSYAERYRIFLERMIGKKHYDRAAFIITEEARANSDDNHVCLYDQLSGKSFLDGLLRHVQAYYFD